MTIANISLKRLLMAVMTLLAGAIPEALAQQNPVPEFTVAERKKGTKTPEPATGLSYTARAKKADRLVSFGDSTYKHVVDKAYVKFHTGTGAPIKSLGLVARHPFAATLTENGTFTIAGNKGAAGSAPAMFVASYDKNGNKKWEQNIPTQVPTKVYSSEDDKYTALVLFNPDNVRGSIQYYDARGKLLFTDNLHSGISGIEFLSGDKVVVATGRLWYLYSMSGYKLLASGALKGNTVGQYPITAHPSRDVFTVVSVAGPKTGLRLQAFNGTTGALLAESVFPGEPYWQPYRLAEIAADGTIQLTTPLEVLTLRLK